MRKILFHIPKLGSGGIERLEEQWRPYAEEHDIRYVFSVVEIGGELYDILNKKKYSIYKINKISDVGFWGFIKQYIHIIRTERIYGVHVPASPTSSFTLFAAMLAGCKLRIIHAHTNLYIKGNGDSWGSKQVFFFNFLNNLFSNVRCTGSKSAAEYCFGKKRKDVIFIHNGINTTKFQFNEDLRISTRKKLGIDDCFVIGHVGRFTYQKNQVFLIDLLKEMKKEKSSVKLILLGEGEDESNIKDKIRFNGLEEDVLFLGTTSNLAPYYCAMDAFVFPSRYEGLGIAVIEAQCSGLRCLVSENVPDDAVILANTKKFPLSIPISDLAKELLRTDIFMDRSKAKEVIIKSGYDEEDTVKKMIDVYRL